MSEKRDLQNIQKKMKLAEALFNFAYEVKYFRLKSNNPNWTHEMLHQKTMELIDRGCE